MDPLYVDDAAGLERACEACAGSAALALDTEFERSVTYYPRPALIQLGDGEQIWLLDPLALNDLEPLGCLLDREQPLKIMHSVTEDLSVLRRATGREPATVFDTQLAAALAGQDFGLGYHALVKLLLGIDVSKDQTRSNWLRRPLSSAQLRYAAIDVAHLHELHRILTARLEALGRLDWLAQETQRLRQRGTNEDVERDFTQLANRVEDDQARGVLFALCAWREREAQRRDRPRRHIVDDPLLVTLARERPGDQVMLERLPQWQEHRGRAEAVTALRALTQALQAQPRPVPLAALDLREHRRTLECLKQAVVEVSRVSGISAALLAPRRMLESAVIHARMQGRDGLPQEFRGWRAELLEAPLLECLRSA